MSAVIMSSYEDLSKCLWKRVDRSSAVCDDVVLVELGHFVALSGHGVGGHFFGTELSTWQVHRLMFLSMFK